MPKVIDSHNIELYCSLGLFEVMEGQKSLQLLYYIKDCIEIKDLNTSKSILFFAE